MKEKKVELSCGCRRNGKRKYYIGYTGIKCMRVAMCYECGKTEYIGSRVLKWMYPTMKKIYRNRVELLELKTERVTTK